MTTGVDVRRLVTRDRAVLLGACGCLVVLSWLVLSAGHAAPDPRSVLVPHTHLSGSGGLALTFLMWWVMMVAMMLPPVMPWILLFASTGRERNASTRPFGSTALFVTGYFTVWAAFCLVAAWTQRVLLHHDLLQPVTLRSGPYLGSALLLLAGLFQLTPFKSACLRHCRSPLGFFLARWRDGPAGALEMGLRHGAYCLGCCWALMALCFALGVMNLLWMAILTVALCAEKIAPGGAPLSRVFGLVLAGWGLWLLGTSMAVAP